MYILSNYGYVYTKLGLWSLKFNYSFFVKPQSEFNYPKYWIPCLFYSLVQFQMLWTLNNVKGNI